MEPPSIFLICKLNKGFQMLYPWWIPWSKGKILLNRKDLICIIRLFLSYSRRVDLIRVSLLGNEAINVYHCKAWVVTCALPRAARGNGRVHCTNEYATAAAQQTISVHHAYCMLHALCSRRPSLSVIILRSSSLFKYLVPIL